MPTLHFAYEPSNEELRRAIADLGIHCYRFTGFTSDGLAFTVEEVDLWASLSQPQSHSPYKRVRQPAQAPAPRIISAEDLADFD